MPQSKRSRRTREVFRNWRTRRQIYKCLECGKKLRREKHHYLCNECWQDREILKKKIRILAKDHILSDD